MKKKQKTVASKLDTVVVSGGKKKILTTLRICPDLLFEIDAEASERECSRTKLLEAILNDYFEFCRGRLP